MTKPSNYEIHAWRRLQMAKPRPMSRVMKKASEQVANGAVGLGKRAGQYLEDRPGAKAAFSKGQEMVGKGAGVIRSGARKTAEAVPEAMTEWGGAALDSVTGMLARAARIGLSPRRVVEAHQKRGHDVSSLLELRHLDLEQIDAVRGRGLNLYYPIAAALSGMGAGLVISGGALVAVASAGAAAAPSGVAVAGAITGDAAVVLGLASRSVGHVSLFYGYDPEEPSEKLFVMSVVNAGTAMSASAKTAALSDISRLTQALVRGKAWKILDKSVLARVSHQFAKAFGVRFTKQSLGKVVPAAGIVIGGGFNWATLESIVDAADTAYRRRFLLEKYPHLMDEDTVSVVVEPEAGDDADEIISVLGELAEAGGPDLHYPDGDTFRTQ
ncbi:EcsC family protein [Arthrobacter sp. zg-Y20]|uniref:EcsC family protein n=1 Tax=unclassified Arthrobacter TaxID=235627 RepID=UPI001D14FD82|nr:MULTISPECIES: EcsC family protein [unclassified Arthrobacter]MCC3276556.1 EcsC family protein [Arthrobacter sp. zg-Y20]MDK1316716.1 EcsC family protein [Arthrobacter sp. zg.Y20]WIB06861.1 EcsC family protein [Arthrobacter sp. zg-Y20]